MPVVTPKRPSISVFMVMSADGKTATANRLVSPAGSPCDQHYLQKMRASSDAIMVSAGTIETNDMPMEKEQARHSRLKNKLEQTHPGPWIVVASSGSVNPNATIFKKRLCPIIILTPRCVGAGVLARLRTLADDVFVCGQKTIDWSQALPWLRKQWGIRHLLCEGDGDLNASLLEEGCINELHLAIRPLIFGGRSAPTIADGTGCPTLADAAHFRLVSSRCLKGELFLVFRKAPGHHP